MLPHYSYKFLRKSTDGAKYQVWSSVFGNTMTEIMETKSGVAINTPKARQEYEPLGQSVRASASIVLDPPGSSPSPISGRKTEILKQVKEVSIFIGADMGRGTSSRELETKG